MKNLGLYKDNLDIPRKQDIDVVASRVSTNEDNIAMLDSDMETAQGDILTLKTNVTEVTNALTSKQDKIVGGASTITHDNLTANRALVSNSSGKVAVSAVTSTELGYLDGVTSNVQTQLDSKLSEAPVQSVNSKTGAVTLTKSDIGLGNVDNVKQYSTSNPPPYPVTSVNGQTGAVTIESDVPENIVRYYDVASTEAVEGLNADMLEGHRASYFATASGLSDTNTQVSTLSSNLSTTDAQVSTLNSGLSTANNNISELQTAIGNKVDKSGGVMTGKLVAQDNTNYTIAQVRNVIISTANPSGGSNGMIWIKYTP